MAEAGRAKGSSAVSTQADLLVERKPAYENGKSESGSPLSKDGASPEDRSFAKIHTGDRAVHHSVSMTSPTGSPPAQADPPAPPTLRPPTPTPPPHDPAAPHS